MDKYIEDFYNAANKGRDAGVYTGARETPTVKRDGLGDAFDSGLRAGTLGLGSSIDYFQSLVGTVVGNEDMAERNIKEAQFGEALAGSALAGIEEFSETLENPTFKGALTQVSKFGGQGIPSLLYSVGSLATGGLVGGSIGVAGKTAAKKAAEKIVKDKISKAAAGKATAEEVAEAEIFYAIARDQAKKRGAKFGAFAGAGAAEYPSLAGENFGEALESGQERDRDTAFRSAAVAVPQTVIGVGTEAAFLKIIAKEARKRSTGKGSVFGQLAKAASVGGARGASLEGFSEYLQTEIGIQNRKSYDATYSQEEANLRRMEAAFAGAVIGGFAGGAGGIGTSAYQNREGAVAAGGVAQEKTKTVFNKAKKMWDDSVSKREFDRQEADAQEDVIILGQDEDSLTDQQREDLRKLQEQEQRESGQQRQSDLFDDEAYKEYNDLYKDDSLTTQQKDAINKINALPESFSISDFQLSMKIGFNPTLSLLKSLVEKKLITRNKDGKFTKVTDEPVRRDMRTSGRPDAYGNPQFPVTPGNVSSATAPESKNLETERVNFRAKVGENLASLAAADPKNTRLVSLEKQYRTSDDAGKDRILKTLYAEKTQIEVDKNTFLTDEDRSNDLVTDAQQAQAQDNSINETAEFETVATGEAKQDPSRVFENTASSRAAFIDTFSTEENPISFDNPFYAGMSESFLRTAVVEQNSNPDVEVNFSRDGNTYTAVVPNSANPKTPLLKTLKKASRTLKAKGSGVFLIDQDGNSKAIDLRVLTNAGVKILQERGDVDVYSLSPAERQALGLQTFLAEMQLAETFQDITFGGTQSLFDIDNTRSVRDQIPDNVVGGQVGTEELLLVDMLGSFESTGRSQPKYTVVRRDGPNVKFNSATEAQAFKDALEYGDGEQGIYIKKETYNLGPDEEDSVEFGVDEQTRANEQLQFPDEDTRQTDPIPLTTLNLEFGASNTPSKGEGRLNSSGQTGKTYQKPEYPFGELSNTVTRFLGRAATLIKPRKPVAVIGLKELQTFSNEDIVKKFNDPEAANFIQKAALDLQNTDGKLGEYFGFGNVHVVLIDNISVANDLQNSLVASHEALGHVLYQEELNASLAQPELRKRLERDFEKARTAKDAPFQYQGEYGFEEWYADQVAIKAKDIFFGGVKTNKKNTDKGLVARYFTKVVDKFKKLWSNLDSELRRRFGKENASQAFSDYMNNHIIKERAKYQAASTGPALKQISFKKKALVRSMEVAADTRAQQAMGRAVGKMSKLLDNAPGKVLLKLILAEDNILRGISPTIANMFYVQSNAEGMGSAVGFIKSKDHVKGQVFDQLEKMLGNNWDTKEVKDALREASSNTSTAEMKGKGREVRDWLDNFWEKYISKVPGNDIGKRENYFPVALNLIGIQQNPDAFVDFIVFNKPGVKRGDIIKIVDGLVARQSSIINEETEITFDATDPVSVIEKARELTDGIEASIPDEFVDPPEAALMKYIRHVVTRSEFKRATHDKDGTNLLEIELAKLPKDQKEQAVKVIERYLGYTKTPMNPKLQKLQSYIQLFNWVTLLPLATIGSIAELGGVIVNSRELRGFEFAAKAMKGNLQNREQVVQLARTIGVAWSTSMGNLGLTDADAEYLDPQVRKWSDKFFQVTMLDAFTRFTREFASATGVQFFLANADPKTASDRSTRYLEDHGVTAEQVNDWYSNQKEGEHFTFDGPEGEAVMAGLQRFVENSMLRPNAAERPGWANNPHYQLIWALKSYLYSFGKVIVGGLKREMGKRLGESNNVMDNMSAIGVTGIVAAVAFMPLAMLSLELRELAKASIAGVLPGVEPSGRYFRSDRMDYADYLGEMFDRAGYMGPLSIIGAMFKSQEWGQTGLGALFGPTVGLVVDDIGMGLYKGEGWDIVPSRIIPGYNLVL